MRRFLLAPVLLAGLLAGCSGAGGTATAISPPAPTTPTPTPSPSPTATPNLHPAPDGATVTFAVDSTTVDTPASAQPKTSASSSTVTETVHTGATFNGQPATDIRVATADGSFVQDNYEGFVSTSSGQNYVGYGSVRSRPSVPSTDTIVYPDTLILDELPELTGAKWNNSLASSRTISSGPANNHTGETIVQRNDGSAVDTVTFTDGNAADTSVDTFTTRTDGSASATHQAGTGSFQYSFGVPVQNNGVFVIPVTYTDQSGTQTYSVPDWYPGHGIPAAPFATDSTTDLGAVQAPPAACSKAPQIPATRIQETGVFLDLFGFVTTITQDFYYAPARGLICYVVNQTVTAYDNYATGAVTDVTTTTFDYALTSGIGIASTRRRASFAATSSAFLDRSPPVTHMIPPRRAPIRP